MTNNTKKLLESKRKLKIAKKKYSIIIEGNNQDMLIKTNKKWSLYVFIKKCFTFLFQFLRF